MIYESLDNALFEKDEKFKKTQLKNPDHNIEKYNLYGFTSGVQQSEGCHQHGSSKRRRRFPAFCNRSPWRLRESTLRRFIRSSTMNLGNVLQTLEQNSNESSRKYWLSVKDYLPSIPDWVHKHQPSINAMPSFGRAYIPSYVYNSPYIIPPVRRGQNVRPLPRPQIMEHAIDMSTSVDVNPLRGLEDSSLFAEFDRWFTGDIRVRRRVQHPRSFFQIILGTDSMGWLGDEHIHEYLRLISEKQRQYPNALLQRVTHTDTFFWLLILVNLDGAHWVLVRVDFRKNKVWIYDSLLTFRDDKRYKLKFKPLEVIFPQWLEYVGFYNIRPELQSTDPWKLRARHNKSPELAIAFNASHVEYFKKKIAVDIFNDDIVL
ncbi:hypothetical protein CUMW_226240 [Citrus unshiu]|uniref:Ubiquitin-like protease family profile domain-containing protein n=1 Tax=Citrus unshiu TaxID=55188 RepID=A0A2H5QFW3_CITUN|nr:hypothetical protein CUMW_226240 [Citrus unshiu]